MRRTDRSRCGPGGHKPHNLALGDRQAQPGQKRHDPLAGHLALKMKHQHQTMQMRTAAPDNPRRERRNQPLAVRRLPSLPPIACRFGLQHQVLNNDVLGALVARASRGLDRKHFRTVDRKRGDAGAAPPLRRSILVALGSALWPICRLLHSGRLHRRTRRQMLQPRDLVPSASGSQPAAPPRPRDLLGLRLNRSTSPSNRRTKPTSSVGVIRSSESLAPGDIPRLNQAFINAPFPPGKLPRLLESGLTL